MSHRLVSSSGAGVLMALLLPGTVPWCAENLFPDFDLKVDCPERLSGPPAASVRFNGKVILRTDPRGSGATTGARAWSLGLRPGRGAQIVGVTTQSTDAALAPDGLREGDGYEKTELTRGPDNEGAVSAIILSFAKVVYLPVTGESVLLHLELEAPVPGESTSEYIVDFADGLVGSGQPVKNTITWGEGFTRRDDGSEADDDADGSEPCIVLVAPARPFVRGDANEDAAVDLTDAVLLLEHLFRGGAEPACLPAADSNDDGGVNLSDVVFLLSHLFRGGDPPPSPFPACGADGTPDALECVATACP